MGFLKMLDRPVHAVEHPVWLEKVVTIAADQSGIFYPSVDRGSYVEAGMKVGRITDYFGRTISEPTAPVSGVITFIRAVPSMTKGETVANVGVVKR
jgi:predicted deacylase